MLLGKSADGLKQTAATNEVSDRSQLHLRQKSA